MKDCRFCQRKHIDELSVLKTEFFTGFFGIHPVSAGHFLIIPNDHIDRILDLSDEAWTELKSVISKSIDIISSTNLERAYSAYIEKAYTPKVLGYCTDAIKQYSKHPTFVDYNFGVNDGPYAGRTIPHLHFHIIPRYKGDVQNEIGGIRNIIEGKGDYTQ